MKHVTKILIRDFKLKKLGFDFMGYTLQKNDNFTFHHLIIPNRLNGPSERWNGAILCGLTAHPYLHVVEAIDYDSFLAVTSELIDMNVKGYLDIDNLMRIDDILGQFEKEWIDIRNAKGKRIIKEDYTKRLLKYK